MSSQNQIQHVSQLLIVIIGVVICVWFIEGLDAPIVNYLFYLIPLLLVIIPTIYLHVRYYFKNRHYSIRIIGSYVELTVKENIIIIVPEDVDKIIYELSPSMNDNRPIWAPWNHYRHIRIFMKNGNEYIITSLIIDDFTWLESLGFPYIIKTNLYRIV